MGKISVSAGSTSGSNLDKLKMLLPSVYKVEQLEYERGQQERFQITTEWNDLTWIVSRVVPLGDQFIFEYEENAISIQFLLAWIKGNAQIGNLLWLIVYPWRGAEWTYIGSPAETRELAVEELAIHMAAKTGAMLIAFKASQWPNDKLVYEQSFSIRGELPKVIVNTDDMGGGEIVFTNLE